ncbi:MAG: BatA domain-containing protein [Gemmatimonadaceae bacterium]
MTWLAPGFLVAGVLAALAVVVLHLIALQRPRRYLLPTARFVPVAAARAAALTRRPSDWLLLVLRALAVLALAAAFARPVVTPERRPLRQLIVVDRSDAVADVAALRDSVLAHFAPGDAIILVDSVARAAVSPTVDSLRALTLVDAPASLAAGLVAARRTATSLADSTDSLRIVVVSPFAGEALDAAVPAVRDGWPGALRLVRLAARVDTSTATAVVMRDPGTDDALAAGVRRAGMVAPRAVRLLREAPTPADSAWASEGGLLLTWPATRPAGWADRAAVDSVGALVAGAATVVAPFARPWTAPAIPAGGRVAARWVDGEPAAVEQPVGAGCVRTVGVPLDARGDLTLRPAFGALLRALVVPCGGARDLAPISDSALDSLRGGDAAATSAGAAVDAAALRRAHERTPLVSWLLALSLLLLVAEWAARGWLGARAGRADAARDASAGATPATTRTRGIA